MRERVAGYLADKLSASQIGAHIGVSRNAIIGLVRRDKKLSAIGFARLPGRKTLEPKTVKGRAKKKAAPHRVTPKPATIHAIFDKLSPPSRPVAGEFHTVGVPMMELRPTQCRFAVNDAAKGELHLFCGKPVERKAYCLHHWHIRKAHSASTEQSANLSVAA